MLFSGIGAWIGIQTCGAFMHSELESVRPVQGRVVHVRPPSTSGGGFRFGEVVLDDGREVRVALGRPLPIPGQHIRIQEKTYSDGMVAFVHETELMQ